MQAHGSLAETPLRSLLERAQGERSTGTLTLHNGSGKSTALYFLFGHLFHAVGEGRAGDDAVVGALNWPGGEFEFDPKAKLPSDETVKSGIAELVRTAESAPTAAPEPQKAAHPPKVERDEEPDKRSEAPSPRRGVKHRPSPKHGRETIPVPAGQVIYDSLKTSFVDFPRLITTLEKEAYTGYVRLLTDDAAGLIFFREGSALECVYDAGDDPEPVLGKPALMSFNEDVTRGHGVLDVVGLSPELVDGLYELTVSKPKYSDLYASWVDMRSLLKFLDDRKLNGSVLVRATAGTGVIILTDGKLTGAYTSESRDIADKADRVLALCEDPGAMIEVKSADGSKHPPLDVDEIVAAHRAARGAAAVAPPPIAPEPPPPAPMSDTAQNLPTIQTPQSLPTIPPPSALPVMADEPPTQSMPVTSQAPSGPQLDWPVIIAELQAMSEDALGNRARKVKDILGAADPSLAGIEGAIDQIPTISLLFVDSSRLEQLAQEMRTRLKSHL